MNLRQLREEIANHRAGHGRRQAIDLVLDGIEFLIERVTTLATADEVKQALQTESDKLAQLNTDLQRVASDIADLKNAGGATPEQLDELLQTVTEHSDTVTSIQDGIDAVDPAAITPTPTP